MSEINPEPSPGVDTGRHELVARIVTYLCVLGSSLFVFFQLSPSLLFSGSTDVGGDNAAHVVASFYFLHHLFPHLQLSGWDPQWFGGFPLYVFYFPLPAVVTAILSGILSFSAAFKVVTVLGSVFLPLAAYGFGRCAGFARPTPALMSVAMVAFLFNTSYTIDGGNIPSTLAGEYSFSLALVFALLFLGSVIYSLRTGRRRWIAPILFVFIILCHVVPALFAAGGAALIVVAWRDRGRAFKIVAPIGIIGAFLSAFWLLRFSLDLPFSSSMGYTRVPGLLHNLFPSSAEVAIQLLAIIGALYAIIRANRVMLAVTAMALGSLLAFNFLPSGLVFNGRWLPFWFLTTSLIAAYAMAELGSTLLNLVGFGWLNRTLTAAFSTCVVIALTAAYLGVLPFYATASGSRSFIPSWVAWNYSGYQAKAGWSNFGSLVTMLEHSSSRYGCGRLDYEYSPNFTTPFGSTLVPMSLPMWTNGCIASAEGVYFESSTSTPFHFLDQAELSILPSNPVVGLPYQSINVPDGVRHLALTGVQYFLANSAEVEMEAATDRQLTEIASTSAYPSAVETSSGFPNTNPKWVLYLIHSSPLVRPLQYLPVVEIHQTRSAWLSTAIAWYQNEADWPVVLTTSGPPTWRRVVGGALILPSRAVRVNPTQVSKVHVTNDSISFHVSELGRPVLVNIPYFPNWNATGAAGPYLGTPNMMVVIPYAHSVSLSYQATPSDWAGRAITLIGLALLLLLRHDVPGDSGATDQEPQWVQRLRKRHLHPDNPEYQGEVIEDGAQQTVESGGNSQERVTDEDEEVDEISGPTETNELRHIEHLLPGKLNRSWGI